MHPGHGAPGICADGLAERRPRPAIRFRWATSLSMPARPTLCDQFATFLLALSIMAAIARWAGN